MARAYSLDLRERVVGAAAAGQSCRSVAKTFMINVASVVKWSQRQRAVGSPAALKMGGCRPYLVARERDWVLSRIAEKPDLTLRALLKELAERGLVVSYYALWHFLQHEGVTFKKAFAPPNRTGRTSPDGVSGGRRVRRRSIRGGLSSSTRPPPSRWQALGQNQHDAHPWPMRQRPTPGRQNALRPMADADVSGGAALRRVHRPCVIDGPINGASFRAYVEQALMPILAPGDIAHEQSRQPQGPRRSRRHPRRQSQALFLPAYSPDLNPIGQGLRRKL